MGTKRRPRNKARAKAKQALFCVKALREVIAPSELTERQFEILLLAVTGMRHQTIARVLCISINTLKRHVDAILKRTEADSIGELRERFRAIVWGDAA